MRSKSILYGVNVPISPTSTSETTLTNNITISTNSPYPSLETIDKETEKMTDCVEDTNKGNVSRDIDNLEVKQINKQRFNSRSITKKTSPNIYVNDGSNGTNLINTHSYKNYCTPNEKPTIENNYSNNFKSALTTNTKYNEIMTLRVSGGALNSKFIGGPIDGFRLHPTGDSGGYSNFTISHFIKGN